MSDPINVNVNIGGDPARSRYNTKPAAYCNSIYFIFIGWWLGGLAITLAYFFFIPDRHHSHWVSRSSIASPT